MTIPARLSGSSKVSAGFDPAVSREAAQAARNIEPGILICNMDGQRDGLPYVNATIEASADFLQFLHKQIDPAWTKRLKLSGVRSNFCCTDEAQQIRALFAAGVDFVLVDRLEQALDVARDVGIDPLRPRFAPVETR